jgi:hypothetical protein
MEALGTNDLEELISTDPESKNTVVVKDPDELKTLLQFIKERDGKLSHHKYSPKKAKTEIEEWLSGKQEEVLLFARGLSEEHERLIAICLIKVFQDGTYALKQSAGIITVKRTAS